MIRWLRALFGGKREEHIERLNQLEERDKETRERAKVAVKEAALSVEAAKRAERAVRNV